MNQKQNRNNRAGALRNFFQSPYLLLSLAPLFWSGNFILGRFVHDALPPLGLAFWRWLTASIIITLAAWSYLKKDLPVLLKNFRIMLLLSILGVSLFNSLAYMGLRYTSAVNGVLMQSALPVVIVLMSYLFFRETIRPVQTAGIIISLCGVLTIITKGDPAALLNLRLNSGDIIILIAVFCYAAYSALLRRRPEVHPLSFLAATFIAGTVILFPFYLWETMSFGTMPFNEKSVLAVGYVAVFPSILAYFCFNRGVELLGANRAGLFIHLMPVFGSLMAVFFLGEELFAFHGLGILMILAGIFIVMRGRVRYRAENIK